MTGKKLPSFKKSAPLPPRKVQKPPGPAPPPVPVVEPDYAALNLQHPADQQVLLDIFSDAFARVLFADGFPALLQELKQALFNRDFAAAFGREDFLEAYAARWSPTRALGYGAVFLGIRAHLKKLVDAPSKDAAAASPRGTLRMVCVGGCAAEHLAFASYVQSQNLTGHLTLVDSGPWSSINALLEAKTTSPPPLSAYASATAKATNHALLTADQLALTHTQQDILALEAPALAEVVGARPVIVTLMFTLNELYTRGGIAKTTKLLKNLGEVLVDGSLVLVVDSPGSYSETALGKEKKRYPMQWLLDHTLLETTEKQGYSWDKLESDESVWFRLPDVLNYPIPLENMRYQLHLYRLEKAP
ncbi:hypothetical protein QQX98_001206 [Neonectria punicea]|uniref:25S rRNA (Uridine(2843)-N(3))-methyltransferase n=1 Tax=Neonectria punicea TaxID=979145 RepID=A0ABR1HPF6_9HYPO